MDAVRWDQMEALFEQALILPPDQRFGFLDEACGSDAALRAEVASLLASHEEAPSYFEGLAEVLPPVLAALAEEEKGEAGQPDPYGLIGKIVSRYRIVEKLGGGGMGVVYKAEDLRLKRTVALKFLPPAWSRDAEAIDRFMQEAQAASALDHPNIGTIHEIDEAKAGQLFIVMACYEGEALKSKIARGPLPVEEALDYAVQIAQGLAKAHERGIVHRDIKPANVMITRDGVAKIIDFGLAKMADVRLTKAGTAMGTVAYMSPEQARGEEVDHRTDLWSLGVVLYEMLTGSLPFRGEYEQAMLYGILHEQPEPVTARRSDLLPELEAIVNRCLAKEPEARYGSADELLEALERARRPESEVRRPLSAVPLSLRTVRWPFAGAIAVALVLLLVWLLPPSVPKEKHVAVLPCSAVSGEAAERALCDGLAEMLTWKLTPMQHRLGIGVVPASEMRASTNEISIASDAWQEFGANLAVAVNVQRRGDEVRVDASLIDAKTLSGQLGMETVEVSADGIVRLQDQLILVVAQMLGVELPPQRLRAHDSDMPRAYLSYLEGRGYLWRYEEAGNLDAALVMLRQAVAEDPTYALAYAGLGEAYLRRYEASQDPQWADSALSHTRRALALDDQLASAYVTLGLIHVDTGQGEAAVQAFQGALSLDSLHAAAYAGLANVYEEQGKLSAAESTYVKVTEILPHYWVGYYDLGAFYRKHARSPEAVAPWRRVIELVPDRYNGYNNLGTLYAALERWSEALEMFKRSIERERNVLAFVNLGTHHYYHGRYTDAALMYRNALELDRDNYVYRAHLALAYHWAGERDKAQAEYRRAIAQAEEDRKLHPNDPNVLSHLAAYYAITGERTQALELLGQAVDAASQSPSVMLRIGYAYEHLLDREKALYWIDRALENGVPWLYVEGDPGLHLLRADEGFLPLQKKYAKDKRGGLAKGAAGTNG